MSWHLTFVVSDQVCTYALFLHVPAHDAAERRLPLTLLSDALPLTVRALLAALRQLPPNSASHRKALEAVLTSVLDRCLGPATPQVC